MSIYEKPTKVLMREFAQEQLQKGQIFGKSDAVRWFAKKYPQIKSNTVQMHVEGMAVNSSTRKHHPSIKPGSGHDMFFKVSSGAFRLWEPEHDSQPRYRDDLLEADGKTLEWPSEKESLGDIEITTDSVTTEFAFERDLRSYLAKNLMSLERGLTLYQDEDFSGVEFPVGGRFIDILANDKNGNFVVIELKVSRGYDRTIGQLLCYMGWIQKNLAGDKKARGMIVANEVTEDLKLAASLAPDITLAEYELSFKLKPVAVK